MQTRSEVDQGKYQSHLDNSARDFSSYEKSETYFLTQDVKTCASFVSEIAELMNEFITQRTTKECQ